MKTLREKFFSKISVLPNGCAVWTGWHTPEGYGIMKVDGKQKRVTHVSFFLKHGRWPYPQINHTCDTPACVRIGHIYEGTPKQNMDDMVTRGRGNYPPQPWRQAQTYDVGRARMTIKDIAARAGVTQTCIWLRIQRGITGSNLLARSHQGPRRS